MNNAISKRIKGLFKIAFILVVVIFGFGVTNVFAEDNHTLNDCPQLNDYFKGFTVTIDGASGNVIIRRRALASGVRRPTQNYNMRIYEIEVWNNNTGARIYTYGLNDINTWINNVFTFGHEERFPMSNIGIVSGSGINVKVVVKAETINKITCGNHTTSQTLVMNPAGTSPPFSTGVPKPPTTPENDPIRTSTSINVTTNCTFDNQVACYTENGYTPTGNEDINGDATDIDPKDFDITVKCPYDKIAINDTSSENYYINKHEESRKKIHTVTGQYTYNSEFGVVHDTPTCKVACEEKITVEYGAPIASTAGFCFEYKVRVTSKVDCKKTKDPEPPRKYAICPPYQECSGGTLSISTSNGGPNEDFDKCVVSCDGGKYSDKCVNKCYKQVYGNSTKISYSDKQSNSNTSYRVLKVESPKGDSEGYRVVNGETHWVGSGCTPEEASKVGTNGYVRCVNGIATTADCGMVCSWRDNYRGACGDSQHFVRYLNDGNTPRSDYDNNLKKWENLKKQCEAYASCSTTTAEFTISADYQTTKNTTVKRINFPYSTSNDAKETIKYQNENSTTCTKDNNNSILLSSAGCYNCGKATHNNFYQAEWSFPGAWINNKTGELTFDKTKVNNKDWQNEKNKFCLPQNIRDVNAKWYNYYMARMHGNDTNFSYNDSTYTNNIICPNGTKLDDISHNYRSTTFTNEDVANIKYNINAIVKDFGFYKWDINIKCFYAVNSNFPCEDGSCKTTCDSTTDTNNDNNKKYRIRTVDLGNMFPDSAGNKLTTTDTTGRTPGFNWTQYSSQTIKDPTFTSVPSNYVKWIQAKGYNVYSDDYLDYEVVLTKDIINTLKRQDQEYAAWLGETETNSVINYQSPLFRNGGILSGKSKYPNGQALKCNNMKNYKSSECEDYTGEVR